MSYDYEVVQVKRVVDGDTVDLVLDLGFYLTSALRFRIYGVDTPELRSSDPDERVRAQEAQRYVEEWCAVNEGTLRARTYKADSFGRWLCDLYSTQEADLANDLIMSGHGVPYSR